MSFDLYLLPLPEDSDFKAAMEIYDGLESGTAKPIKECDRRALADLLITLEPRYEAFRKDYAEIARFEGITESQSRENDDSIDLYGEIHGKGMAQFIVYDDRVVIHWYSGTSEEELIRYISALCREAGYTLVDPQSGSVFHSPEELRV